MTELYDAVYRALNKYPGWDDSAVGYGLKNNETERRKIARAVVAAVAPILDAAHQELAHTYEQVAMLEGQNSSLRDDLEQEGGLGA